MFVIFSKVLVVFIYVAIGFGAYRLKVLNDESVKHLTSFLLNITCPALMISSVVGAELKEGMLFNTLFMLVLTFVGLLVAAVLSQWIAHKLPGVDPLDANVMAMGMTTTNSGFMGFPVTQAVLGQLAFYYIVIQNISLNIYMYSVGIWQLNYHADAYARQRLESSINTANASGNPFIEESSETQQAKTSKRVHIKRRTRKRMSRKSLQQLIKPFCNLLIITSIVSTIMLFAGIRIPDYAMNIFETIGNVTIPTSMIIVGIQLGASNIRDVLKSWKVLFVALFNLIIYPAAAIAAVYFLPIDNIVKITFGLSICFPSAAIGVALSNAEGRNSQLMAEIVAATTLLSMITLPVWIGILSGLFPI